MKKITVLIILLFLCFYTNAQPGYQGKRFIAQYSALLGPRITAPSFNQVSDKLGINYTHSLGIDYTISRKHTIGVTFSTFKTSIADEINIYSDNDNDYPSALKLHSYGAEFNIKFSGKKTALIAPIGFYQKVGIGIWLNQIKDNTNTLDLSTIPITKFTDYTLSYGLGKRMVYFDRLVLDLGVDLSLSSSLFKILSESDFYGLLYRSEDGKSYQEGDIAYIETFTYGRFAGHAFLNFRVGIGFLL
jgi:hypothetical protein